MNRPAFLRRQIQRMLALLMVAASFASMSRAQMSGVMGAAGLPGMPAGHGGSPEPSARVAQGHEHQAPDHPCCATSGDCSNAAPKALPWSAHDYVAHCPFCFTATFALAADRIAVLVAPGRWLWRAAPRYVMPHMGVARQVHARAPPHD